MEMTQLSSEVERPEPQRVDFGKRLGAYLLDMVASWMGGFVIGVVAGASFINYLSSELDIRLGDQGDIGDLVLGIIGGMLGIIAGTILTALLNMILEAFTGQSIGKMILGIKNGNDNGTNASSATLIFRAAVKYISTTMFVLFLLTGEGYLWSIGQFGGFVVFIGFFFVLGEKRQGFHDMITKTCVYSKSELVK